MFRHKKIVTVVTLLAFWGHTSYAMIYDNRFFPLIKPPFISIDKRSSYADIDTFITTAHSAWGDNDENITIPQVFGKYDQNQLAQAIALTGQPNPLVAAFPTDVDLFSMELPWLMRGKIQAQGLAFAMRKTMYYHWLSVGFSWLFMRSNSAIHFRPNFNPQHINSPITMAELDELRSTMERSIGITSSFAHQTGMGDLDLYVRAGNGWEYIYKCRRIFAGVSLGALVPTGEIRNIDVPASVPFGGNGHPGFYVAIDLELEVKEDMKVGFLFRGSKRSPKKCIHRMSACKEPEIFGAITSTARVNPGGTIVFAPYASLENIRDGFGALIQFNLTNHEKDGWIDFHTNKKIPVRANVEHMENHSSWRSSYVLLYAFYDFGKMKTKRNFEPIFTVEWDVPVNVADPHGAVKTQKVALGFEFNF